MTTLPAVLRSRFPSVLAALERASAPQYTEAATKPFAVDESLAVLWAQSQTKNQKPNTLYLVSGFGEHIQALLPRLDPTALVVVYEASLPRLKATLLAKDYEILLSDERLMLFAGPASPAEFERLQQLPLARVGEVTALRFSPAWQLEEKTYDAFFAEFVRQLEAARALHLASFNDGLFWQATTFQNLLAHSRAPDLRALKGLFADVPAILVGAGPSLDEAEGFLKQAAGRALIIAVNSSYRKLRNLGLKPHLVLAADPRADTAKGFLNQPTQDGPFLIAPFIVNPEVIRLFGGRAFSWSGENNPLISVLRQRIGLGEGTTLLEKGTISLSVADLVFLIGAKPLILVGQDMALAPNGQTHTKDSIYEGLKISKAPFGSSAEAIPANSTPQKSPLKKVPGNTIPEVETLGNLYIYLKSFEQWVQAHPTLEVLNTSRLGAKIQGVPYATYEQVLQRLPVLAPHPAKISGAVLAADPLFLRLQQALTAAPESKISPEAWQQALEPTRSFAQKLFKLALKTAVGLEALPERYYQPAYKDHREVKALLMAFDEINNLIDKNPDDYRVLLEGKLKKTLLEFQRTKGLIEAGSSYAQQLLTSREFFWALVEGIEPILAFLEEKKEAAVV